MAAENEPKDDTLPRRTAPQPLHLARHSFSLPQATHHAASVIKEKRSYIVIEDTVTEQVAQFKTWWEPYLVVSPKLALDGTWPSVGVLDLLTFHLRLRSTGDWTHAAIVKGVAAYIAVLAHDCWLKFGAEPRAFVNDSGVCIETLRGPFLKEGQRQFIAIEKELRRALKTLPSPFPVIGDYKKLISIEQNMMSLFALGVCSGLSPFGDGPWNEQTPESFEGPLSKTLIHLASTSATHYERLFPDEPLGQVGELYLEKLIYPPMLMDEELPAWGAVQGMIGFFTQYQVPRDTMQAVSHNLAMSPDELISLAGFAMYAAVLEGEPSAEMLAIVQGRQRTNGLLRPAMIAAREALGLGKEWIGQEEYSDEVGARFVIEKKLGFLPWISISKAKLRESFADLRFQSALAAAIDFDLENAITLTDAILEESPDDIELRIQRVCLEALLPNSRESVYKMLRSFSSEPAALAEPRFHDLMGTCLVALEDVEGAKKSFKTGIELTQTKPTMLAEFQNNLGWVLMMNREYSLALEQFEQALKVFPRSVSYLLNKGHSLWRLEREEEMKAVADDLVTLGPTNRSVFSILISREAGTRL